MIPTIYETRRVLGGRVPARGKKIPYRSGFFYTSPLGYICYKPSVPGKSNTIGHGICTVAQFKALTTSEDSLAVAASVVISTMHQFGQPTTASLYDLERALGVSTDANT